MIYESTQAGVFKYPGWHKPNDKRFIGIIFRPETWVASTVYGKRSDDDYDVMLPTVFNGFYFKVKNPGKSLTVEPTYVNVQGMETTQAGTSLVLEAVAYNLLPLSETITSVTYVCTNSVTVSSSSSSSTSCQFLIDPLPAAAIAAKTFQITATVNKSNTELVELVLQFKVANQ